VNESTRTTIDRLVKVVDESLRHTAVSLNLKRVTKPRGAVVHVGDGVARVVGLNDIGFEELMVFDSGAVGMAYDLGPNTVGAILLSGVERVQAGEGVVALYRLPSLRVGRDILGRIVDPLGNPLDDGPELRERESQPLFRAAPEFVERKGVDRPLHTGIMVIDAAIPIGRGQRELIVGDRNVGKTALALDIVAAQKSGDVICVYVVVGQPFSRVLSIRDALRRQGAMDHTAIVAADASMSPGMRYLAPYAGASVAEWFRDNHRDALIVYDDLTKHADAYRELALLLDRPPGREAFPGDIFYIHAELLERAAPRRDACGGGSVTALPIVETTDSDISGYIPTNLISITDGQIYLDTSRFERNERPAVDIGRSVSRIGAMAQPEVMRAAAKNLRILMSRFEAVESLVRVGLDVDSSTARAIHRGRVMRELLRQSRFESRSVSNQVLLLTAVSEGWLDVVAPEEALELMHRILLRIRTENNKVVEILESGKPPEKDWKPFVQTLLPHSTKEAA
jgi:F-type H+/Na+-transporting ATPase subunit alpha